MREAILAVLVFVALALYGCEREKVGELRGSYAHLLAEAQRRDSVYRVEVSEYANQMLHYKNLRDTVRITDTVWVKRFIVTADSTIHACSDALQTCEHRVAIRDSIITILRRKPSVLHYIPWVLGGVIAGKLLLH